MSTPVWTWPVHTLGFETQFDQTTVGPPGYRRTFYRDFPVTRSNLIGTVTAHRGVHIFTVGLKRRNLAGLQDWQAIQAFLAALAENGKQPFYFYNQAVRLAAGLARWDATGADLFGRHLVIHIGDSIKSRLTGRKLQADYQDLVFEEKLGLAA